MRIRVFVASLTIGLVALAGFTAPASADYHGTPSVEFAISDSEGFPQREIFWVNVSCGPQAGCAGYVDLRWKVLVFARWGGPPFDCYLEGRETGGTIDGEYFFTLDHRRSVAIGVIDDDRTLIRDAVRACSGPGRSIVLRLTAVAQVVYRAGAETVSGEFTYGGFAVPR